MSAQTTSLSALLGNNHQKPINDPSAQFRQMPGPPQMEEEVTPVTTQMPSGAGQGLSAPNKEFFGLKETDYKTAILVFAIILILSSGIFYSILRPYVPGSVGQDGKVTLIGSLIAAIVGTLLFVIIKSVGKF